MANPNYDNCILGSGIAGLTVFYYLAEKTRTRNLLITNNLSSQTSASFPLGPRLLHNSKDTEALLRRLGFSTTTREVFVGYKTGSEIRNFASDEFKQAYALKSRKTSKVESSFLSDGKSNFAAFDVSQVTLGKALLSKCISISENNNLSDIIVTNIKSVDHKKIATDKSNFYADNIISTIPLNALTKLLSNGSMTLKISTAPDEVSFFLVDEKGAGQFNYIYSITDPWYRKTYAPEMDKWVYETKTPVEFVLLYSEKIIDKVKVASQIASSRNLKELGNIKLVGRYAQMNHSIKTEDVIHWAHNYTRKFQGKKNEKAV